MQRGLCTARPPLINALNLSVVVLKTACVKILQAVQIAENTIKKFLASGLH
jgi:hypothetical protein